MNKTPAVDPALTRKFSKNLAWVGAFWLIIGSAVQAGSIADVVGFIQIFFWTALDLVFLMLIFARVFFSPPAQRGRTFQILLFVFFKLVCLGFLAITLKRFRNAPLSAIVMGIGFMWIGPMIAGLLLRKERNGTRF